MPATVDLQALRDEKAKLVADMRAIHETADAENRDLTAEETASFNEMKGRVDEISAEVRQIDDRNRRSEFLEAEEAALEQSAGRRSRPGQPGAGGSGTRNDNRAYRFKFRGEDIEIAAGTPAYTRHTPEGRAGSIAWIRDGLGSEQGRIYADLQTDSDVAGGYLTAPEQLVAGILEEMEKATWIRKLARQITSNAQTTGIRKRTNRISSFQYGSELQDATAIKDVSLKFGKRVLTPHHMTGMILLSRDLLKMQSGIDVESYVRGEMARDAAEAQESNFLLGDGNQKPLGVFVPSADGISTARDVSTGNTTTAITADNFLRCKMALRPGYRQQPSTAWLMHTDVLVQAMLLKDGNGQYLWHQGLRFGEPDRLLNIPVYESEFAPNTLTTGQYTSILGDWNYYLIVDSLALEMQRLVEAFATTNQIGLIGRLKNDGMAILEEAFVRQKLS